MSAWIIALLSALLGGGLLAWLRRYQAQRDERAVALERARQTDLALRNRARLEVVDAKAESRAATEHAEIEARPRADTTAGRLDELVRRSRE